MNKNITPPIVSITGTKGKTTVVYLVDEILRKLNKNTLRVDTTGHFVNGRRISTLEESRRVWRLVPSVCPGRFLYEFTGDGELRGCANAHAILECSLGSSNAPGLGYKVHDVGVFLNVFEDHLGSSARLRTQNDIADAKEFIFRRIARNGSAVFNADDRLVCSKLKKLETEDAAAKNITKIPCGREFTYYDIASHLGKGGSAFTINDNKVILMKGTEKTEVCDLRNIPWTFNAEYEPSNLNLMYATAAVYSVLKQVLPSGIKSVVESLRLDPYGGRLTVLRAKSGATIIADYAHEKRSLLEIAKLAKSLAGETGGEVIGLVRLAYDRTDELIKDTGESIANSFDRFVVWDKIDGYWQKPKKDLQSTNFVQKVGMVSNKFAKAIELKNKNVTRLLREDEAYGYAAKNVKNGDVVVAIVNDDVKRSVDWIREKFSAEFI